MIGEKPLDDSKTSAVRKELLEEVFQNKYEMLCHFSNKIVKNMDAATGIVTDAFIRFMQYHPKLQEETEEAVIKYLCVIVRRLSYDWKKKQPLEAPLSLDREVENDPSLFELMQDPGESVEDHLAAKEQREELLDAMKHLPPNQQKNIQLNYIQNLSHAKIAKLMGVSVELSRTLSSRAIRKLRSLVGQAPDEPKKGG